MTHFILRSDRIQQNCAAGVLGIDLSGPLMEVVIRPYRKQRSLAQNRMFHMWLREISDGYEESGGERHSPEVWKQYLKNLFLGHASHEVKGRIVETQLGTSDLNTAEFTAFLERVDHYAATELGVQLTHPDIYGEAMGENQG